LCEGDVGHYVALCFLPKGTELLKGYSFSVWLKEIAELDGVLTVGNGLGFILFAYAFGMYMIAARDPIAFWYTSLINPLSSKTLSGHFYFQYAPLRSLRSAFGG
jgi:hypothetical protein